MKDLECPYCGHEQDAIDINEPRTHEYECKKCEKYFEVTVEYWPSYSVKRIEGEVNG